MVDRVIGDQSVSRLIDTWIWRNTFKADRANADVVGVVNGVADDLPVFDIAIERQRFAAAEHEVIDLIAGDDEIADRVGQTRAVDFQAKCIGRTARGGRTDIVDMVVEETDSLARTGHINAYWHVCSGGGAVVANLEAAHDNAIDILQSDQTPLAARNRQAGSIEDGLRTRVRLEDYRAARIRSADADRQHFVVNATTGTDRIARANVISRVLQMSPRQLRGSGIGIVAAGRDVTDSVRADLEAGLENRVTRNRTRPHHAWQCSEREDDQRSTSNHRHLKQALLDGGGLRR